MSHNIESTFTTTGFSNWIKASERMAQHQKSLCHREAFMKLQAEKQRPLEKLLSDKHKSDQENRRHSLMTLLTSLQFLLRQGLAIRGHTEVEGNLVQLMKLKSSDFDSKQLVGLGSHYTSPEITNEVITLIGHSVLRDIVKNVQESKFYAVICDETRDISNKEQFSI